MLKKPPPLFQPRSATRHFLFSTSETGRQDENRRRPADARTKLKALFPELRIGKAFTENAAMRLSAEEKFVALVICSDSNFAPQEADSERDSVRLQMEMAAILDAACKQQNGWWGVLDHDLLGGFIPRTGAARGLKLAHQLQDRLIAKTGKTASVGVAAYPTGPYARTQVLENARKALAHAAFFGAGSAVIFDAVSLNISADKLFEKGDVDGAVAEFKHALMLDANNVNVRNSLGVCYALLGDFKKAAHEFKTAVARDGREYMALYNLGLVSLLDGQRETALDFLLQAERVNPDIFEVAFQIGKLYLAMSQPEKGQKYLERAAGLQPDAGSVFRYLGEIYSALGKWDEATTAYKKAVKNNPHDAAALSALGWLFEQQGENPDIALMFCRESVQLAPQNGLFRHRLGRLYFKQHQLDKALKEFTRADVLGHKSTEFIAKIKRQPSSEIPGSAVTDTDRKN